MMPNSKCVMSNVYIVSFPRSGQHLVRNLLSEYCKRADIDFRYCEFYRCCASVPCTYHSRFMKNHDFALDTTCTDAKYQKNIEWNPHDVFIVLYRRDVVEQLEAWYRFFNKNNDYDVHSIGRFACTKLPFYEAFVNKWVHDTVGKPNVCVIDYDELVSEPQKSLTAILQTCFESAAPLEHHVHDVCAMQNIHKRYRLSDERQRAILHEMHQ